MPRNLWSDADAASLRGVEEVLHRAHLLGQDPSLVNWKGGNISMKQTETLFDGTVTTVLRIKGSGSDLKTTARADFPGVRLDWVLPLEPRADMSDEEMTAYLGRCCVDLDSKRPSIETLLHAFLPFAHIDHTHADAINYFAACADGEKLAREVFGDEMVWIPYRRPGFLLSKQVAEGVRNNPKAACVILAKHGFINWGATNRECYHNTLALVGRAQAFVDRRMATTMVFGGAKHPPLSPERRRELLAAVLPPLRGALSKNRHAVTHVDDGEAALEFVNSVSGRDLAAVGAACPDHIVSTKRVPLFSRWDPAAGTTDDLRKDLLEGVEAYRRDYAAWFDRCKGPKDVMDDPSPRVILVPGVGMITAGKDKAMALAANWLYHRAMAVMKGASTNGRFVSLDEKESFDIEYWPLERYKLTQLPPDRELAGRVALVTGAAGGIGRAAAIRLAAEGAHVVAADRNAAGAEAVAADIAKKYGVGRAVAAGIDVTDEARVAAAFETAVLAYGGVDLVVACAGISSSAPVEATSLDDWNRLHAVLGAGYFLTAREAFRIWKRQGTGGNLVCIASKNGVVAGKDCAAYSTAKAAELHLVRCLAEEGGPHGIRVNAVNPDAVMEGSGLWDGGWREQRARAHGVEPAALGAYYRERTLLKTDVRPEDIAEAVLFFASGRSGKTTGNFLNVDGGVAPAFPR
jgi:rhamnulose-1-phosphate aldolase/alcohol dehydrogenase